MEVTEILQRGLKNHSFAFSLDTRGTVVIVRVEVNSSVGIFVNLPSMIEIMPEGGEIRRAVPTRYTVPKEFHRQVLDSGNLIVVQDLRIKS